MKKERFAILGLVAALSVAIGFSGCSTLSGALSQLSHDLSAATAGNDSQAKEPASSDGSSQESTARLLGFTPYEIQFYSVLAASAPFGGNGTAGRAYKPGEGTAWELSNKNKEGVTTVGHALLKVNGDGSQWWRLELVTEKDALLYEYLQASDETISKVRYRNPDTNAVMEFVPDQSQTASSDSGDTEAQPSEEGTATHEHQNLTVRAGTFSTDHAVYVDQQQGLRSEVWTSVSVPGGMVKYLTQQGEDVGQGELVKIEQGMTTVLESF